MADTLLRQWAMLRAIPRAPRKIDAETLRQSLSEEGFDVSIRSIQRDLNTLSACFPLVNDDRGIPYGWSWRKDAVLDVPGMDPPTALTFDLLTEKRFQARYRPRDVQEPTSYEVNPLGLVLRDAVTYLVCTLWDYDDIKQLALHRILEARPLEMSARRPESFALDDYIAEGQFAVPYSGKMIALEALFDAGAAYHLRETKLSENQVLKDQADGRVLVKATVRDTGELRWWLLGFGDGVEVIHPASFFR